MTVEVWGILFVFLVAFILVFRSVGQPRKIPILQWIGRFFARVLIGAFMIFFLNVIGSYVDFHLPINPVTAFVAGILGFPGLALLVVVKLYVL